ncbi:hypothetical protein [Streptomyces bohaiensis]|uniref:Integral membrane protein n=1 Tax=Streptomyces bohaiensis TaxID=1431344 RepID=A0ABX1CHG6_9ACTN|nr:hypothetical protein [Streptomyces bohaiensis]NJQ17270.1 hypothetical protein [Streptomyces bohaiensis]
MSYGDDYDDASERGIPSQTRTHYPDEEPADRRRRGGASPRRSLSTVVGVFLILIAAIVFANRAGDDDASSGAADGDSSRNPGPAPTAPSGEDPVGTALNGIPSGFPQTQQGAESAAANYAVALGGEGMFTTVTRQAIVDSIYTVEAAAGRGSELERIYTDAQFLERVGLDESASAPSGMTFVARVVPVGTNLIEYDEQSATVSVWYTSLFGLAGEASTNPVTEAWYTNTFQLVWEEDDWKVVDFDQTDGPVPVGRDQRASTAEEMAEASEQYGGFTYAR